MRHILVADPSGRRGTDPVKQIAHNHTIHWLRNPDPGSPFAKKTLYLRLLPDIALLPLLHLLRYNGLIFLHNERDEILGHVFFQSHADGLHMFSVWVVPQERGKGSAVSMIQEFLLYAWNSGCRDVRMGTDRNLAMSRLRERVFSAQADLPFVLTPGKDGWAKLTV